MSQIQINKEQQSIIEQVLVMGDLARLNPDQRNMYYQAVCSSLGLNSLTRPFEYITLNGKLQLYARKDCTDQLRKIHGVSVRINDRSVMDDLMVVTAEATDKTGRVDSSIGAVSIAGLRGEAKANALMKAETKARRRVTLALCGLGVLDETEIESIPNARIGEPDRPVRSADRLLDEPKKEPEPSKPALPVVVGESGFVVVDIKSIEEVEGKSGPVWKVTAGDGEMLAVTDPIIVSDLSDIRENGTLARCEVQKRGNRRIILGVTEVTA